MTFGRRGEQHHPLEVPGRAHASSVEKGLTLTERRRLGADGFDPGLREDAAMRHRHADLRRSLCELRQRSHRIAEKLTVPSDSCWPNPAVRQEARKLPVLVVRPRAYGHQFDADILTRQSQSSSIQMLKSPDRRY